MTKIERILIVNDTAEGGRRAEARAAMLGIDLKAVPLDFILIEAARADAAVAGRLQLPTASCHETRDDAPGHWQRAHACGIREEEAASAIATRVEQFNADLAIVSAGNLEADLFRRPRTRSLVATVERPLLIANRHPRGPYESVLVATDFSEASLQAAQLAFAVAPSAYFVFLHAHAFDDADTRAEAGVHGVGNSLATHQAEAAREEMNHFILSLGRLRRLVSRAVVPGPPVAAIAACAERSSADLIVVGRSEKSHGRGRPPGQVAAQIAVESSCDLLVVPASGGSWDDRPAA